ncbi:MAG: HAD superfamily hydrolase (TIGR01509 family) [Lentimonas sp.]|jgi:HAD superfamily hydrolase (TIGR01509 family)
MKREGPLRASPIGCRSAVLAVRFACYCGSSCTSLFMQDLHHKYEGLIFDMDGTLADTMPTHFVAWSQSMAEHGLELSEERFYALGGVPAVAIIDLLAAEQGVQVDSSAIAEAKELLFLELLGEVQPVVEVRAIAEYHRGHLPMAVATGSPKWVAEKILKALGMLDWFEAVVGAECVAQPKPAPDVYLRAAELAGVDPQRCHAFEDTELGMESARNAGMTVININTLRS